MTAPVQQIGVRHGGEQVSTIFVDADGPEHVVGSGLRVGVDYLLRVIYANTGRALCLIPRYRVTLLHSNMQQREELRMAQSAAERQRAYGRRHLDEGNAERLNVVVRIQAKRQLERLARRCGVTQRELLEMLLAAAERRVVARLADTAGYYG